MQVRATTAAFGRRTCHLECRHRILLSLSRHRLAHNINVYLRPVHKIRFMSSQPPQVLSTELLNTADAKYVNVILPRKGPSPVHFVSYTALSLKVGQLEEDQLARPKWKGGK